MEALEKSVLPLCHGYEKPPKSIKETLGNALIFDFNDGIWLLTCRHLMEKAWKESMIKSVKLDQEANYFMMWKKSDNLRYHPSDTSNQSLNLALYYFGETDAFPPAKDFWTWQVSQAESKMKEEDPLKIIGIRSDQMTPESIASSKPLPIAQVDGIYLDNTLNFSPEDYSRTFIRQQLMRVPKDQLAELSGGLVAAKGPEGWYPRGIVTGSGTVTIKMGKKADAEEVGIYTFTDFVYLNQMLEPGNDQW